jgi:hypothetical protein
VLEGEGTWERPSVREDAGEEPVGGRGGCELEEREGVINAIDRDKERGMKS